MDSMNCTSVEAIAAVGYLQRTIYDYPIDQADQHPKSHVVRAIDYLRDTWKHERRPWPNEIAQAIIDSRPRPDHSKGPYLHELEGAVTPPDQFTSEMAKLKAKAGAE